MERVGLDAKLRVGQAHFIDEGGLTGVGVILAPVGGEDVIAFYQTAAVEEVGVLV